MEKDTLLNIAARYRDNIVLFVCGYIHDFAAAEDIASDIFVKLIMRRPKLNDKSLFKTYLYAIAKNTAVDYLRKRKRERRLFQGAEESSADIIGAIDKTERNKKIYKSISALNEDYRNALFLHYFEEMTHGEIAAAMKKNKKQVYNLLHRGKEQLKQILLAEGICDEDI